MLLGATVGIPLLLQGGDSGNGARGGADAPLSPVVGSAAPSSPGVPGAPGTPAHPLPSASGSATASTAGSTSPSPSAGDRTLPSAGAEGSAPPSGAGGASPSVRTPALAGKSVAIHGTDTFAAQASLDVGTRRLTLRTDGDLVRHRRGRHRPLVGRDEGRRQPGGLPGRRQPGGVRRRLEPAGSSGTAGQLGRRAGPATGRQRDDHLRLHRHLGGEHRALSRARHPLRPGDARPGRRADDAPGRGPRAGGGRLTARGRR